MTHHHPNANGKPTTCADIMPLLGAYSIGATTPEETQAIEAILPHCPEAVAELADYVAVSEAMLYLLPLERDAERSLDMEPLPPLVAAHPTAKQPEWQPRHVPQHAGTETTPRKLAEKVKPVDVSPERKQGAAIWWLAAALLAVALGTNALWYQVFGSVREQQAQQVARLDEQLRDVQAQLDAQADTATVASGNTSHIQLTPQTDTGAGATAQVIYDRASGVGTLLVNGLPEAPSGHSYQVWLVQGESDVSLGTFAVDDAGFGTLLFQSPVAIVPENVFGISTEPLAGSPNPTTPHHLTGRVGA